MRSENEHVTFSFGENWNDYLDSAGQDALRRAERDIATWMGRDSIAGKTVLDIGSGSGIHSLVFHSLGAKAVTSFDADPASVCATRRCWEQAGRPDNWTVLEGSVLDTAFLHPLGKFDVVYAWGVLHHTGRMWDAIANAFDLVETGGRVWISLYTKGPKYPLHLALKRRFNSGTRFEKSLMIRRAILRIMASRLLRRKNPFTWNETKHRGMNRYHDLIDWLGGLPYEVAAADDVLQFAISRGFGLQCINAAGEGACSTYVFTRSMATGLLHDGAREAEAA